MAKAAGDGYTGPERAVARIINGGWDIMNTGAMQDRARQMLEARSTEGYINALPWQDLITHLGQTVGPMDASVGRAMAAQAGIIGHAGANLSMTGLDRLSQKYAQEQSSQLIKNITDSQRTTIRGILSDAQAGDYTVDQAAREIRKGIGLHPAWAQAVRNYEARMSAQDRPKGYSPARWQTTIDARVARYQDRLIRKRSLNIARTEIITAENLGRYATWAQAIGAGDAAVDSRKEWAPGPGACRICETLAGEITRWDEPFSNGAMMPPAHPSCRCSANLLPPAYTTPGLNPRSINWTNPGLSMPGASEETIGAGRAALDAFTAGSEALDAGEALTGQEEDSGSTGVEEEATPAPEPVPELSAYERDLQAMQAAATATKADQLTYESTLHWSDDKLMAEIANYAEDPEAVDKILDIIDQRAVVEDAKAAAEARAQASYEAEREAKLEAQVQAQAGTMKTEESPALNPAKRPERNLNAYQQAGEEFQHYMYSQYSKALEATNGNFFNAANHAAAKKRNYDEIALFSGPYRIAQKYASEELLRFWETEGRETLGSFRYKLLGRPSDKKAADVVAREGLGRKAASYDRSNL